MGYNPYEPVMSSTSAAKGGGITSPSSCSSPEGSQSPTQGQAPTSAKAISHSIADIDEEVQQQFVAAVECLLNQALSGVADQSIGSIYTAFSEAEERAVFEQGQLCINTVVKMLTNLIANPEEPKFR